jgi:hypothetical protein
MTTPRRIIQSKRDDKVLSRDRIASFELNEQLLDAVADINLSKIQECLQAGADIHYVRSMDGDRGPQPVTVLSMVMFRISDALLEPSDFLKFKEITALLLAHGADTDYAMTLAEHRYGTYDATLQDEAYVMMPIWHLIAQAHAQRASLCTSETD